MSQHLLRRLLTVATVAATFGFMTATPALAAAPANDDFTNAEAHTAAFTDNVNIDDATTETDEPTENCGVVGKTVWYSLTLTTSSAVTIDTYGSGLDTVLGVYQGNDLPYLSLLGCNDDYDFGLSQVTFNAVASRTYWIQAGGSDNGYGPEGGDLQVNVAVVALSADLSVSVSDSADPVGIGDIYEYTITVTNNGPDPAFGLAVPITLSGAARTLLTAAGGCSYSPPVAYCSRSTLASGTSYNFNLGIRADAVGTVTATAVTSTNSVDPTSGNNTDAETTTVGNPLGCTIIGTAGNDTLNGTGSADVICGLGGNDTINGGNGNDTIYGGAGADTVDGGNNDDTLYGGAGDDIMGGGNGADYLYGEAGNDTNYGETLLGSLLYLFDNGNDHIYGGPGNDDLDGQNGNDTITDTDTDDTDTMSGGNGNDTINVQDGAGDDTANGNLGTDTCTTDTGDTTSSC
ncbi:calcium-binding protein [Micromonospora matsumotoense]|uniref:calcium-binding protein n=1 Tax=Micromonospora matsumotoense TaxID=121616 RepID=UPI00159F0D10|nr:DUF11 domain-containing protein [Micromonospora matsumotoense]